MINALNLIWIIPLSICLGMLGLAFIIGATENTKYEQMYDEGVRHGMQVAKYKYELKGELHET